MLAGLPPGWVDRFKALHRHIKIHRHILWQSKRTNAADRMACQVQHIVALEHARFKAEAMLELAAVDFAIAQR